MTGPARGLRADAITVRFHGAPRLGPWNLDATGGTHVLTGPSGCGKSTLLRCLVGAIPHIQPAEMTGAVTLDGDAIGALQARERPGRIGWMDQGLGTVTPTTWEEIALPLENQGTRPRDARRRIDELLATFQLEALAHRPIERLSGGESARVCFAAAVACEPDLLLLDEPLAQLDVAARRFFIGQMRARQEAGGTTIAATHHPEAWDGATEHRLEAREPQPVPSMHPRAIDGDPAGARGALALEGARVDRGVTVPDVWLPAGSAVALVGPNGSGKTTLLRLAAGLLAPAEGTVRVDGVDPASLDGPRRAKTVGVCFQDPAWHITQDTVWQEATWTAHRVGAPTRDAAHLLDAFGIRHLADRHPWDLSGGQRQRLAAVTALAHRPHLALLDEPTRGMDHRHRLALRDTVQARIEAGLTTIVATHDEELAAAFPRTIRLEARA